MGNNRIGTKKFLNQHCALALDLESMFLAAALKIVLQHNLCNCRRNSSLDETSHWTKRRDAPQTDIVP
jgi:hypothetical protein